MSQALSFIGLDQHRQTHEHTKADQGWPSIHVYAKSLQLFRALCNPLDCSLSGSSVHGTLQARRLEWVVMSSSGRSS